MVLLKLEAYKLYSFFLELLLGITSARAVITLNQGFPVETLHKVCISRSPAKEQNSIYLSSCLCFIAVGITLAPLKHMRPYLNDINTRLLLGTQKTFVEWVNALHKMQTGTTFYFSVVAPDTKP